MSSIRPAIPCKARTRTGEPCRNYAIVGGRVCFSHGGRAPQVRRAAQRRIAEAKAWKVLARQQKDWDTWRSGSMAALGQELHYINMTEPDVAEVLRRQARLLEREVRKRREALRILAALNSEDPEAAGEGVRRFEAWKERYGRL
jgi:hypothetical protein